MDELPESKLEEVASGGSLDELKELLHGEHDFCAKSEAAAGALRGAAQGGNWDSLRFLVEQLGVEVRSVDTGGVALQHAAAAGKLDILRVLAEAGADLSGRVGANILLSSASTGRLDILEYALANRADVLAGGGEAALGAAKLSRWAAVMHLVQAGIDLDEDGIGVQLLALAATQGQHEVVELLKDRGVSVESEAGVKALAHLAVPGEWDICSGAVLYLADNGVDLNSAAGDIALITASRFGDLDMVQRLAQGKDMRSKAAGEAVTWAGELGTAEGKTAVVRYLSGIGAVALSPPKLVLDADF